MARYSVKRTLVFDKTPVFCIFCHTELAGARALKSHNTQMHSGVKDTSLRGRPLGTPAWNKGLTKATNACVAQYSKSN